MESSAGFSLLAYFKMGGGFMWPLLVFSIFTVAVALERLIFLSYHNLRLDDLKTQAEGFIRQNNFKGAEAYLVLCSRRRLGARILLALIRHAGLSENRMEKVVEAEALSTINSMENGFTFLTALGSLAPLTGFLGTVSGMIAAFRSIAEAVEVNAQIVANGIYEALITTVFGLVIAIVALTAHAVFSHMVDRFAEEVEKAASDLITAVVEVRGE
jgi:biopolymer transport protein ExbB